MRHHGNQLADASFVGMKDFDSAASRSNDTAALKSQKPALKNFRITKAYRPKIACTFKGLKAPRFVQHVFT
jgi:hypothetical protein